MTAARSQLVDMNVTRYYHCISRCNAFFVRRGFEHREQWIEDGSQTLTSPTALHNPGEQRKTAQADAVWQQTVDWDEANLPWSQ